MAQTRGTGSFAASVYGQQRFFRAEKQVGTQVVYELAALETQCISEAPSPSGIQWPFYSLRWALLHRDWEDSSQPRCQETCNVQRQELFA